MSDLYASFCFRIHLDSQKRNWNARVFNSWSPKNDQQPLGHGGNPLNHIGSAKSTSSALNPTETDDTVYNLKLQVTVRTLFVRNGPCIILTTNTEFMRPLFQRSMSLNIIFFMAFNMRNEQQNKVFRTKRTMRYTHYKHCIRPLVHRSMSGLVYTLIVSGEYNLFYHPVSKLRRSFIS